MSLYWRVMRWGRAARAVESAGRPGLEHIRSGSPDAVGSLRLTIASKHRDLSNCCLRLAASVCVLPSMTIRDLIRALVKHDLDLEVVIPADHDIMADFMIVSSVRKDVFAVDRTDPGNLVLAQPGDDGARIALRLCAGPD